MTQVLFAVVALFGVPLFLVFGGLSLYLYKQEGINAMSMMAEYYRLASQPVLLTIPLFTLAGYLLAESKAPTRLVNVARSLVGWMPGGIAIVSIISCAFFTAFTGASGVTIIALGGLLYPILRKEKYSDEFSMGLITSCGSLGLLFPPSLPLILYGMISSQMVSQMSGIDPALKSPAINVDNLFMAGIIPGIILMTVLSIYAIYSDKNRALKKTKFSLKEIQKSCLEAIWELPLPIVVLVGIYKGFITPSEAAAVTAFYVLIVEVFIYKDLNIFTDIPRIIKESMLLVGGILVILGVAMGLTNYLVDQQVPDKIFNWVSGYIHSKWAFLIVLNLFLLAVGMMMDIFSAIIVVVPIITPIALKYGVHPIHLAIVFLTNLEIGYITPPVGLNLFISSFRFKRPVIELYKISIPFLILLIFSLLLITYIPDLSLLLPTIYGK